MNILTRYLLRQIFSSTVAITLITLLLVTSNKFIRIIEKTDSAAVISDLFLLLAYSIPAYLVDVVPLGFFLACILTLSSLYGTNEMTAIFASGVPYKTVLKILLLAGAIGTGLLWFSELYVAPHYNKKVVQLQRSIAEKNPFELVQAGEFNTIDKKTGTVLFVRNKTESTLLSHVFFANPTQNTYLWAESAKLITDDATGRRYFQLNKGIHLEARENTERNSQSTFATYAFAISDPSPQIYRAQSKAMNNRELLETGRRWETTEFIARVSYPPIMLTLAVLAMIFSRSNPREGRFKMLLPSILLYAVFTTLLSASIRPVFRGNADYWQIYWWVHLLFLAIGLTYYKLTEPTFKTRVTRKSESARL